MPSELVNSVISSPHPPSPRITRRKSVSVTPAMGASTAAGRIVKSRILNDAGIMGLSVTQPKEQSKNAAQDQRASKEQPGLRNADQSDENNAEDNNQTDRVAGQASSTVAPEWND